MKMRKSTLVASSAALAAFAAEAVDFSGLSDLKFAERYAFSTNRAALIETLRPRTPAWFAYSTMLAQTEGRLDDAGALLDRWPDSENKGSLRDDMRARQEFLCYDKEKAEGGKDVARIRRALAGAGIRAEIPGPEMEIRPNTYPSELDQRLISFDALCRQKWSAAPKFRFLAFLDDPSCSNAGYCESAARENFLPDTPGMFDHLLAYLKSAGSDAEAARRIRQAEPRFQCLTLAQLDTLAKALKGNPRTSLTGGDLKRKGKPVDSSHSDVFIDAMLARFAPSADADGGCFAVREAVLKRRMAFAESLGESVRKGRLLAAQKALLALYCEYGLESRHVDLFRKHLKTHGRGNVLPGDDLTEKYLFACRESARGTQGGGAAEFYGYIDKTYVNAKMAECDLLCGMPASKVDSGALSAEMFKEIQERVELNWTRSNPRVFAAGDEVSLSIDVKNVPRMRIAVFELDAAAACRAAKGEISSGIDLDCAVPTFERTEVYSAPSVLRHRETLAFPELKEPGVYVVECSGEGVASRVLVRKGRLRAVERRDAAGHVFSALDEDGRIVKNARVWLGGTVFKADASGEISVPFAATAKEAGRKTAVVEAGRLATAVAFDHAAEEYSFDMSVVLAPESLVAGREAVALVRPVLRTSGVQSTLKLAEKPVMVLTFTDVKGRTSVKKIAPFGLFDDRESVCRFTVPVNLASVSFDLSATVKHASSGREEKVSASWRERVNGISSTSAVGQLFLRRVSEGYILECRGRTGEMLPFRALNIGFHHRAAHASGNYLWLSLQGDKNGIVRLGRLADIDRVKIGKLGRSGAAPSEDFEGYEWKLDCGVKWPYASKTIAAAEGETIELPVRGLFAGAWPGADRMENRVSLLAVNKDGVYTEDCISACSYSNGVLRIESLPAGDYRLTFRTEDVPTVSISVVKTGKGVGDGGVVAGCSRAVTDTGDPGSLRIVSAGVSKEGMLRIRIGNASGDARVHVFAARTRRDVREPASAFDVLAGTLDGGAVRIWKWSDPRSSYVSGRDLGDRLRYILDRRQEGARTGNMLQRPSLLLNPWSVSETDTDEQKIRDGDGWGDAEAPERAKGMLAGARRGGASYGDLRRSSFVCRDFMPEGAAVFANLRPGGDGTVEVDVSAAAGMQDIEIVALDGRAMDCVTLAGEAAAFAPRDLRVKKGFDALAASGRTRSCSSVGELYELLFSLDAAGAGVFADFRFLAEWNGKSNAEKRETYGKYASHELDLFIFEKDRPFFESVVAPDLKNKRRKDFMDLWLLGEDVSEYAAPGRLQDLNALEQCLLARRVKWIAPAVARNLADFCAANPVEPDEEDRRLSTALAEMDGAVNEEPPRLAGSGPLRAADMHIAVEEEAEPAAWSNQMDMDVSGGQAHAEMFRRSARNSLGRTAATRRNAEADRRRSGRRFWRPPERTKEWVESGWYRSRHADDTLSRSRANRFWRDYAAAVAAGKEAAFRSANVVDAAGTLTDKIAALALTRLGFEAKEGEEIVFSRGGASGASRDIVRLDRHFFETEEKNADGSRKEAAGEFVRGRVYAIETIAMNPTAARRRVRIVSQMPEGSFPLASALAAEDKTVVLEPYGVVRLPNRLFYFPLAEKGLGFTAGVAAVERGEKIGAGESFTCNVVAESSKRDTTSWRYVSQKADDAKVLEYLRNENLSGLDLAKVGWRFVDGDFARKVLEVLDSRGVYCRPLWLAGLEWDGAYDEKRIREALSRRETRKALAGRFGPAFKSSLLTVEPERDDVFEHREYWPIVNARTHSRGGSASIANSALAGTWRRFLDTLAAKKTLSADDRLLAAVYLISQDRIPEAEAQVEAAENSSDAVETRMQLDYLKAYLAFSRGEPDRAREIAESRAENAATPLWRGRFREIVEQCGEIARGAAAEARDAENASSAPTLAVKVEAKDGIPEGVVITARNLDTCTLKAYPVDVEIAFSKNPFGTDMSVEGGVLGMKSAWTADVALGRDGEARVALPKKLRRTNLVLVATGADSRAEERIELMPGELDVQVAKEYGQIRVRNAKGRPIAGAYVKVYSRDASGRVTKFHKDGYTDLRGAFDYASVSTDSEFRPAEFALFVEGAAAGVKTLRAPMPNGE